jgi:hypothetical protein
VVVATDVAVAVAAAVAVAMAVDMVVDAVKHFVYQKKKNQNLSVHHFTL